MSETVVQTLADATAALNTATQEILSLQATLTQQAQQSQQAATTVINNFLSRPPIQSFFCDPVNGNDANDGSTVANAKKSLDLIFDNVGITATEIVLLNDALLQTRTNLNGNVIIFGAQPSAAAPGYIPVQRTISFLGTALNSPIPGIGTFCSGLWCLANSFATNNINFALPPQTPGQTYSAHIESDYGTNFSFNTGTITVADQTAGSLVGSGDHSVVNMQAMTYGQGAPGHIFRAIAAGANPNNQFAYVSNATTA